VQPYSPERETEDLAAVIDAGGGEAGVFGHSSGAVLGLEAASRGLPITGVIAYEPPYTTPDDGEPSDVPQRVAAHIVAGRRLEAVQTFLRDAVGVPAAMLPMIENSPDFPGMLAVAHTLPYDFAICGDGRVPASRLAKIAVPTLLVDGANSPPWAARATVAAAAAIPGASRRTLPGQDHGAAPDVIAPVIVEFLGRVEARAPRAQ
jgi:pimeloyl-ACP methyl ester carboxylesterase